MINPLTRCVEEYALPPYAELRATDIVPAVRAAIAELALDLNSFEDDVSCPEADLSWESVMDRLEIIDDPLDRLWSIVTQLKAVANSPALREAEAQVAAEVLQIWSRRHQSTEIFRAMKALRESPEWNEEFTREQKRILERKIVAAELYGVGLPDNMKEQFNANDIKLNEMTTQYANNLLDATKTYSHIVYDKNELDGVPISTLSLLAQNAVEAGHHGATRENGPWKLSLETPAYLPVMKTCSNRSLREKLYRANCTKASYPPHDNTVVIQEILKLRQERAKLLGYESFAQMKLVDRMAPSVELVEDVLQELRDKCFDKSKAELQEIQDFANSHGQESPLEAWDISYWSDQVQKEKFDLDTEDVKPYFPLPRVLAGLFELSSRLFGIQIEAANGLEQTWHPHVLFFQMRAIEKEGQPIVAQFYIDPYTRPNEKQHGAWIETLQSRSKVLRTQKAPVRLPLFSLELNQTPPVGDQTTSLMTFKEVESLLHIFGYGLRYAVTTAEYTAASTGKGVEWDAIEVPSQFMTNFCYSRGAMQLLSGHYQTGESLPDELFDKLLATRNFMGATNLLRQLNFGAVDMALHHHYDPNNPLETVLDVQDRISKSFCAYPVHYDESRKICSLSHIFSGSYAAGYYSYVWSEMFSADAYSFFQDADNEDELKILGRRFRDTYLSLVGVYDPIEAFELFSGRKQNTEALLKRYGLE